MPTLGTTTCLVCGYNQMEPLELGVICPCCGTQYGVSDEDATYLELRQRWISQAHTQWWSHYTPPPENWLASKQLWQAEFVSEKHELDESIAKAERETDKPARKPKQKQAA